MTNAEVIFLLGIVGLALWSKSIFLMITGVVTSFLMCALWVKLDDGWTYAAPALFMAFGLLFKTMYDGIKGRLKV